MCLASVGRYWRVPKTEVSKKLQYFCENYCSTVYSITHAAVLQAFFAQAVVPGMVVHFLFGGSSPGVIPRMPACGRVTASPGAVAGQGANIRSARDKVASGPVSDSRRVGARRGVRDDRAAADFISDTIPVSGGNSHAVAEQSQDRNKASLQLHPAAPAHGRGGISRRRQHGHDKRHARRPVQ